MDLIGEVDQAVVPHLALEGSGLLVLRVVDLEVGIRHPGLVESQALAALRQHFGGIRIGLDHEAASCTLSRGSELNLDNVAGQHRSPRGGGCTGLAAQSGAALLTRCCAQAHKGEGGAEEGDQQDGQEAGLGHVEADS